MGGPGGRKLMLITPHRRGTSLPRREKLFREMKFQKCEKTRGTKRNLGSFGSLPKNFRGEAWMQEPCKTCERRELDFGRLPLPSPAHCR